jgi:trehalose-6-phosphate synthase
MRPLNPSYLRSYLRKLIRSVDTAEILMIQTATIHIAHPSHPAKPAYPSHSSTISYYRNICDSVLWHYCFDRIRGIHCVAGY